MVHYFERRLVSVMDVNLRRSRLPLGNVTMKDCTVLCSIGCWCPYLKRWGYIFTWRMHGKLPRKRLAEDFPILWDPVVV